MPPCLLFVINRFFQVCLQPTKHPATGTHSAHTPSPLVATTTAAAVVRSGVFQLLGTLCELYPAHMIKHADRLVDIYTKTLKQEVW